MMPYLTPLEAMLFESHYGPESDLMREVRLSLEAQENNALPSFVGPPRPIGHWPMKAKRKLTPN